MKQQTIDSCCCNCYEPATIKQSTIFGEEPYCEACYTSLGVTADGSTHESLEVPVKSHQHDQIEWIDK